MNSSSIEQRHFLLIGFACAHFFSIGGLAPIFPYTFYHLTHDWSSPQIFPWGTISQCTMRMPFVVMFEGLRKVLYRC